MIKRVVEKLRNMTADKLAGRVLLIIIVVTAVLFAAFFMVGYDTPFDDDANFNAPILTDLLLCYVYLLVTIAVVVAIAALARGTRMRNKAERVVNGVPAAKIARGVVLLLVGTLAVTFAIGSAEPLGINGTKYSDTFWLKTTDMFINTSGVLLVVAALAVGYGLSGRNRKVQRKGDD